MSDAAQELRRVIVARFASVHRFCRMHPELTRSTVYQALNGSYPGNVSRQLAVIRAALDDVPEARTQSPWQLPDAEELAGVLLAAKCLKCRRPDRRGCRGCRAQTGREAQAVQEYLTKTRELCPRT